MDANKAVSDPAPDKTPPTYGLVSFYDVYRLVTLDNYEDIIATVNLAILNAIRTKVVTGRVVLDPMIVWCDDGENVLNHYNANGMVTRTETAEDIRKDLENIKSKKSAELLAKLPSSTGLAK